ncbi:hypothetical protein [Actinomadura craniellae]|nr:hypothetical protein [Actinomadura craniellae]
MRMTVKGGVGRYTMMFLGIGAAGVAIGWLSPEMTAMTGTFRRRAGS